MFKIKKRSKKSAGSRDPRNGNGSEKNMQRRRMHFETLEPRILLSADIGLQVPDVQDGFEPLLPELHSTIIEYDLHATDKQAGDNPETASLHGDEGPCAVLASETAAPIDDTAELTNALSDEALPENGGSAAKDESAPSAEDNAIAAEDTDRVSQSDEQAGTAETEVSIARAYAQYHQLTREIIIVDSSVPDHTSLVDAIVEKMKSANGDDNSTHGDNGDGGSTELHTSRTAPTETGHPDDLAQITSDPFLFSPAELQTTGTNDESDNNRDENADNVFVLDPDRDGIEQISEILEKASGLGAVHILSHGTAGQIRLGNTQLDKEKLKKYADKLKGWGNALTEEGDILLYGCRVADGNAGIEFVESLAEFTGTDIAASNDDTGSAALGGDWQLEISTGMIESQIPFASQFLNSYAYLLDNYDGNGTTPLTAADNTTGDDNYSFSDGWGVDVVDGAGHGVNGDTLDFSGVTDANTTLTFTITGTDGTVTVTDGNGNSVNASNIENLIGGAGTNMFVFEDSASLAGTIDGNGGAATLDYSSFTDINPLVVNLSTGDATGTGGVVNIQHVTGGAGDDQLTGDGNSNVLTGGGGNDTLTGGGGDDTYVFIEGGGTDTVIENADEGSDTLDYAGYSTTVAVTLNGMGTDIDGTISNIENIIGGSGDDQLTGDSNRNILTGGGGDDTLTGSGGDDTLNVTLKDGDNVSIDGGDGSDDVTIIIDGTTGVAATEDSGPGADDTDTLTVDAGGTTPAFQPNIITLNGATVNYTADIEDVMVTNTALSPDERDQILEVLEPLGSVGDDIGITGEMGEELPLTRNTRGDTPGDTLGELIDAGAVLDDLYAEVNTYLSSDTATSSGLEDLLKGWVLSSPHIVTGAPGLGEISLTAGSVFSGLQVVQDGTALTTPEFTFSFTLESRRSTEYSLSVPVDDADKANELAELGVNINPFDEDPNGTDIFTIDPDPAIFALDSGFVFDFLLGYEFGTPDSGYGEFGDFNATADFDNTDLSDDKINAYVNVGFLGAVITGGEILYDVDADVRFDSGKLTPGEIRDTSVTVENATGVLDVTLPVTPAPGFPTAPAGGDITVSQRDGNFFENGITIDIPSELQVFTTITPSAVLSRMDQTASWLTDFSTSGFFDVDIPYVKNATMGGAIDFGQAFREAIIDQVWIDKVVASAPIRTGDNGFLSGDAVFTITINEGMANEKTGIVTVLQDDGNTSLRDLIDDVNAALENAPEIDSAILAELDDDRLVLRALDNSIKTLKIIVSDADNNTAHTELGLNDGQSVTIIYFTNAQELAVRLSAVLNATVFPVLDSTANQLSYDISFTHDFDELHPELVASFSIQTGEEGILTGDAEFQLLINEGSTDETTVSVFVLEDDTNGTNDANGDDPGISGLDADPANDSLADLMDDVNKALVKAFNSDSPDIVAGLDGDRLTLRAVADSIKTLKVITTDTQLGFSTEAAAPDSATSKQPRLVFDREMDHLADLQALSYYDESATSTTGTIDLVFGLDMSPNLRPVLGLGVYNEDNTDNVIPVATPKTGILSDDATFTLIIDGKPVDIEVSFSDTRGNNTVLTGTAASITSLPVSTENFQLLDDVEFTLTLGLGGTALQQVTVEVLSDDTDGTNDVNGNAPGDTGFTEGDAPNESLQDFVNSINLAIGRTSLAGVVEALPEGDSIVLKVTEAERNNYDVIIITAETVLSIPFDTVIEVDDQDNPTGSEVEFDISVNDGSPVTISVATNDGTLEDLKNKINEELALNSLDGTVAARVEDGHIILFSAHSNFTLEKNVGDPDSELDDVVVEASSRTLSKLSYSQRQSGTVYEDPIDELVKDIQAALDSALGANAILAGRANDIVGGPPSDRLVLYTPEGSDIIALKIIVPDADNNTAFTELGFQNGQNVRALSDIVFLDDMTLSADVSFSAADIGQMEGRYGYLGITSNGGTGSVTGSMDFELNDQTVYMNRDSELLAGQLDSLLQDFLEGLDNSDVVLNIRDSSSGIIDPDELAPDRLDLSTFGVTSDELDNLLSAYDEERSNFEDAIGSDPTGMNLDEFLNGLDMSLAEFLNAIECPMGSFLTETGKTVNDYLTNIATTDLSGLSIDPLLGVMGLTMDQFINNADLDALGLQTVLIDNGLSDISLGQIDLRGLYEILDNVDNPLGKRLLDDLLNNNTDDPSDNADTKMLAIDSVSTADIVLQDIEIIDDFVSLDQAMKIGVLFNDWIGNSANSWRIPAQATTELRGSDADEEILGQFEDIDFATVIDGLDSVAVYLEELSTQDNLAEKLPLIGASVNDILDLVGSFKANIENLSLKGSPTVQSLESAIKEALGIEQSSTAVSVRFDEDSTSGNALRIDMDVITAFNDAMLMNMDIRELLRLIDPAGNPDAEVRNDLAGVTNLRGADKSGELDVEIKSTFELALGIGLVGNEAKKSFLYSDGNRGTRLRVSARANSSDIDGKLRTGPLGLLVVDGQATLENVEFGFELIDGNGRHSLEDSEVNRDELINNTDISPVTGSANATLPLFYPTALSPLDAILLPDGTIIPPGANEFKVEIISLQDMFDETAGSVEIISPGISRILQEYDIRDFLKDPDGLVDAMDTMLIGLQDAINEEVYGVNLPVAGTSLRDTQELQFLENFRVQLLENLFQNMVGAESEDTVRIVYETLTSVFNSVGPGNNDILIGDIVLEIDGTPVPYSSDLTFGNGLQNIEFSLNLQDTINVIIDNGFDTALEALGLTLDADLDATITWDFDFSFGIDLITGFYLDTSLTDELTIDFDIEMADPTGLYHGKLNYLKIEAEEAANSSNGAEMPAGGWFDGIDLDDPTSLSGTFTIDFDDPNPEQDGFLSIDELVSPGLEIDDFLAGTVTADSNINFFIHVKFGANANFPSLYADFHQHWNFDDVDLNAYSFEFQGVNGNADFDVRYADARLGLGEFVSKFVTPILETIEDVLSPIGWLIDPNDGWLYEKDPIMSFITGSYYTVLDSIETFYTGVKEMRPFLDAVSYVYGLANSLETVGDDATLGLGTLVMPDVRWMKTLPVIIGAVPDDGPEIPKAGTVNLPKLSLLNGALEISGGSYQDPKFEVSSGTIFTPLTGWDEDPEAAKLESVKKGTGVRKSAGATPSVGNDFYMDFPLLTDLREALKLFTGEHPTLFIMDLPTFKLTAEVGLTFVFYTPPNCYVGIYGELSADIKFGFGYDTLGLEKYSDSGDESDCWDGFFINDIDYITGNDRPEVTVIGKIYVKGGVDAFVVEASVSGGITGTVYFNLNDPDRDGKVRINELESNWEENGFVGVFDISGHLDWFINASVEVLGIEVVSFDLISGTIYSFTITPVRQPVLATDVGSMDTVIGLDTANVLRLNIGPYASERIHGNTTDGDEIFTITGSGTGTTQTITVSYGDALRSYSNIAYIWGDAGRGNDWITFESTVLIPVELYGGDGDDWLLGGGGDDYIHGGDGEDIIVGRLGDDEIYGGLGRDYLFGDEILGIIAAPVNGVVPFTPKITGADGDDELYGGFGNDVLRGSGGDDLLSGDFGNDDLYGHTGDDTYSFSTGWGDDNVFEEEPGIDSSNDTWDFTEVRSGLSIILDYEVEGGGRVDANQEGVKIDGTELTFVRDRLQGSTVTHHGYGIENFLGGKGRDISYIYASSKDNRTTFNGQKGSDDYSVFITPNLGRITLEDSGPIWNEDRLFVYGTDNDDTVGLTRLTHDILGNPIVPVYVMRFGNDSELEYAKDGEGSGIETAELHLKDGEDTLNAEYTPASISVTAYGENDDDILNVGVVVDGEGAFVEGGIIDNIQSGEFLGPFTLYGNDGNDELNVFDTASTDNKTGFLDTQGDINRIVGLAMAFHGLEFDTVERLDIKLGSGGDEFTVRSTLDENSWEIGGTWVHGGPGDDTVNVQTVQGKTTISGGTDSDRINVGTMVGIIPETPGSVNSINAALIVYGDDEEGVDESGGGDILNVDDTADGNGVLSAYGVIPSGVLENGQLNGDAEFQIKIGSDDFVDVIVVAEDGVLTAMDLISENVITNGKLSGKAEFGLKFGDASPIRVTVFDDSINSLQDLEDDINDALFDALIEERVTAVIDDGRLTFVVSSGNPLQLVNPNAVAEAELGVADGQQALFDNNSIEDLEEDIKAAMAAAGIDIVNRISPVIVDDRLSFIVLSGESVLITLTAGNPAAKDLGLMNNQLYQGDNTGYLTSTTITGLGMGPDGGGLPGIQYDSLEALNIFLGLGNDQFNVLSSAEGTRSTVDGNGGNDVFNVSSNAPDLDGILNGILGELVMLGGADSNTLNISDRKSDTGDNVLMQRFLLEGLFEAPNNIPPGAENLVVERMTGLAPAPINWAASGTYGDGINIWGGTGDDNFTITSTLQGSITIVHANKGDDRVVVDGLTHEKDGLLVIYGEEGADTIDASSSSLGIIMTGDNGEVLFHTGDDQESVIDTVGTRNPSNGDIDRLSGGSGDDIIMGGADGDIISGNEGDDILLGDNGRVDFHENGTPAIVRTTDPDSGGDDTIDAGNGDNVIFGGSGSDDITTSGSGTNIAGGDNGSAEFDKKGLPVSIESQLAGGDDDVMNGSVGRDYFLGGPAADRLSGGPGDDILIGDDGLMRFQNGLPLTAETTNPFTGGADFLDGGEGNDIMFGGADSDTFVGDFSDDIMIGEYARVTFDGDVVEFVVRLGQYPLDLIGNRLFGLYGSPFTSNPLILSVISIGGMVPAGTTRLALISQLAGVAGAEAAGPPPSHSGSHLAGKGQVFGYTKPEEPMPIIEEPVVHEVPGKEPEFAIEEYTVKEGDTLWEIAGEQLGDPHRWQEILLLNPEIRDADLIYPGQIIRIPRGSSPADITGAGDDEEHSDLAAVAAGFAGWSAVTSGQKRERSILSGEAFRKLDEKEYNRRFIKW